MINGFVKSEKRLGVPQSTLYDWWHAGLFYKFSEPLVILDENIALSFQNRKQYAAEVGRILAKVTENCHVANGNDG
jgi:hypothetical protein